jgi:site-specific DNA-methyltransferase (adenine-specific)
MTGLAAGAVDALVTSPPYNLGIRYRSYQDTLPRDRYLSRTGDWVGAAARWLAPGGSLFLNVGAKPTDPWTAIDVAIAARPHLQLQNTLHWVKSIAIDKQAAGAAAGLERDLAVGHYKPINSRRFVNDNHEFIFHFSHDGRVELDRLALGVTDRPHPATFPPRLPDYCLRLHGLDRVRLVADPFLGLGSTAVACATLDLNFVGIELDEGYLREAVARTQAALDQPMSAPAIGRRPRPRR